MEQVVLITLCHHASGYTLLYIVRPSQHRHCHSFRQLHLLFFTSSVCITKGLIKKLCRLQRGLLRTAKRLRGMMAECCGGTGPAVSIDTACSSALVATHLGRQYVASVTTNAESASALAAGVNLMLSETTTAAAFAAGMLTADGRCKTLDSSADGYVRSEACIAVLLTSGSGLQGGGAALNPVQPGAVLRATAVNQDGRSSSLTAPNGPSQQRVTSAFSAMFILSRTCSVALLLSVMHSKGPTQHISDLDASSSLTEAGRLTDFFLTG